MAEPFLDDATASAGDDLYHRLFEEMPIPIAVYCLDEPDNTILYVNRYAREVWRRWESGDVVGLPAMQLTPPDERPMIADVFARLRNGDRIEWIEERLVGPHGHEISVLASTTPVTYHGRRAALLAIHDITDLKKAQAELRRQAEIMAALEERERLARELHDGLGQMLGCLNVQAQATQAMLANGQTLAAQANLQHMAQVAQDTYADLRSHILGLRAPSVQPGSLFTTVEACLREFTALCGVPAALSVPADAPAQPFTPAVETQLLRIIQEALANVRKHAAARKVDVLFSFTREHAQLIISDDGAGFDAARFAVVEAGAPHFGLSIMRERARDIGAQLEVRSAPGKGAQVLVCVPRLLAGTAALSSDDLSVLQDIRVLLVDDHPLFLDGLRNLLLARGVTVVGTARDGVEAPVQALALQPDVVVMDIEMPRRNGVEAARIIKAELPRVKIVMLTVSESEDDLFAALKNGASGYLLKSLDANTFCRLLADAMRGEVPLPPTLAARVLCEFSVRPPTRATDVELTPRQWEILALVAGGLRYKEAAAALNLSEKTIKYHMGQILDRLHLATREQAIAYARRARPELGNSGIQGAYARVALASD